MFHLQCLMFVPAWGPSSSIMPRLTQQALSHLNSYDLHAVATEPDGLDSGNDQLASLWPSSSAGFRPSGPPFRGFLDVVNTPSHHIKLTS